MQAKKCFTCCWIGGPGGSSEEQGYQDGERSSQTGDRNQRSQRGIRSGRTNKNANKTIQFLK